MKSTGILGIIATAALIAFPVSGMAQNVESVFSKSAAVLCVDNGIFYDPMEVMGQCVTITENSDGAVTLTNAVSCVPFRNAMNGVAYQEEGMKAYRFTFPQKGGSMTIDGKETDFYFRLVEVNAADKTDCGNNVVLTYVGNADGSFSMKCVDSQTEKMVNAYIFITDEEGNIIDNGECNGRLVPFVAENVELPAGIEVQTWGMKSFGSENVQNVKVAVDGNVIYMKSLFGDLDSEEWIKGIIDGDKITFTQGQYMGVSKYGFLCRLYAGEPLDIDSYPNWYYNRYIASDEDIVMTYKEGVIQYGSDNSLVDLISGTEGFRTGILRNLTISASLTGVENIHEAPSTTDSRCFDLFGREIKNPTKGTIYIRNGKKAIAL